MKILFIAPYVPSRIRVRPFHIIKELSTRHSVHVLALGEPGKGRAGEEELAGCVDGFKIIPHSKLRGLGQSLMALLTFIPMCTAYCWSRAMQAEIKRAIRVSDFDVVHIEHIRAAHFAKYCGDIPIVFDSVDCLAGLFGQMSRSKKNPLGRLVMLEEHLKLKRYEPKVVSSFQRTVITSESECDALKAMKDTLRVDVVPNGVDTDYFAPTAAERLPHRIVFSGKMGYHPNAQAANWFAENVFTTLKQRYTDAEFIIVGSDPPANILKLREMPGVTVTGYVDDIRPYVDGSSVAVVPMQVAVGIQNKLLEAMAMGLPVVATPISTRPLGENCPGVIKAGDYSGMIAEISRLFDDPASARDIGEQGRREVIRNFSWKSSVGKLEQIYEEATKDFQR